MKRRHKHNLSHGKVCTHAIGHIVPLSWYIALPGDSIRQVGHGIIRMSPLNGPFYGRLKYRTYSFSCPIRLLWDDFEDFITGGKDGTSAPVVPTMTANVSTGSVYDHMRIPPKYDGTPVSRTFQCLPQRALVKVINTYFLDKDVNTPLAFSSASGPDTTTDVHLVPANWAKDWMTTIRSSSQKGPDTFIPVSGTLAGDLPVTFPSQANVEVDSVVGGTDGPLGSLQVGLPDGGVLNDRLGSLAPAVSGPQQGDLTGQANLQGVTDATADASAATITGLKISINDLRDSNAIQRFKEARNEFGHEYPDYLAFLGVTSSDARLRNPEYLGGSTTPVQVSEVLQTSQTDPTVDTNGVGNMYGHGIAAHHQGGWLRYFEEHSIVITVGVCRPDAIYANALEKGYSYTTKEDFWQKEFEHIGQQEVLNQEIFADQVGNGGPTGRFGFQDRYYELRHVLDSISGDFRTTLAYMTTARQFAGDVALNEALLACDPAEMEKLFQLQSPNLQQLWVRMQFGVVARRLLTNNTTPSLK